MTLAKLKVTAAVGTAAIVVAGTAVAVEKLIEPSSRGPAITDSGAAQVDSRAEAMALAANTASPAAEVPRATGKPLARPAAAFPGAGFSYTGFLSPARLIFQADAALVEDRVRLTPAAQGKVGAVWYEAKEPVTDGFETIFQFQISQPGGHGADGLAFVIQNRRTPAVGMAGWHMGIDAGTDVFAVKFRNYHWQGKSYVKYDEIAVFSGAAPSAGKWGPRPIASLTNGIVFSDAAVHTARLVYLPGNLQVFLDDLKNPLRTVSVDLAKILNLEEGRAWVGLTAATGADYQNQDVLAWSFAASASGSVQPALVTDRRVPSRPAPAEPVFAGSAEAALPRDGSFGYALPKAIDLNYRIEASADLRHWSPLTNLVLYFKDPESTNFNERFYRFLPK